MARMASRPRIGAIIRDGMVRKGLRQSELAGLVGASRSAVNAWINDRSWPQDYYIAALEKALDVKLPRWWAEEPGLPADPGEQELRSLLMATYGLTPAEAQKFVEEARRTRRRAG